MPLLETDYCIEQINVPPKLPMILKQFCKSAIRTQPYDLLKWSSAYFNALANGEEPPCKLRLEYPPACSAYGLTLGYLKLLLRQFGADYNKCLPLECVLSKWDNLCLDCRDVELIIKIGRFKRKCQIKKFLAIGTGLLSRNITETMILICELFTHECDGGSAMIPLGLFMELYGYLAGLICDGTEKSSQADICLCSEPSEVSSSEATTSVTECQVSLDHAVSQQLKQQQSVKSGLSFKPDGIASIASHHTQGDLVDMDFESHPEDFPSTTNFTLQSFGEESDESYRHEGEASYHSSESYRSKSIRCERKKMEGIFSSSSIMKKENENADTVTQDGSSRSTGECSTDETQLSSDRNDPYYPNVPGIGGQIKAEEVARVAIWMSECGRRQSGMVGPRNIRHINCPPLDGCYCPKSKSCSDLTDE